jgi:uncharacterized protein (DUF58 family)
MIPGLPEAHAAAQRWSLPFRLKRWNGLSGARAGIGTGNSLEFEDHRAYLPGDDLRHLNWSAFARTGSLTMKVFRQEVSPGVDLAFDGSASMALTPQKETLSRQLLLWATEAASHSSASLRLWQVGGPHSQPRPLNRDSLPALTFPQPAPNPQPAPPLHAIPWRRGSLRVFISDLLWPGDPAPFLDPLARDAGHALLLAPFAPEEAQPAWTGSVELRDCESGSQRLQRFDSTQLRHYRDAYQAHFALWIQETQRRRIPLARLPAGLPLEEALAHHALPVGAVEPRV